MARPFKYDYVTLLAEFNSLKSNGEIKSLKEFAEKKSIKYGLLNGRFKKFEKTTLSQALVSSNKTLIRETIKAEVNSKINEKLTEAREILVNASPALAQGLVDTGTSATVAADKTRAAVAALDRAGLAPQEAKQQVNVNIAVALFPPDMKGEFEDMVR